MHTRRVRATPARRLRGRLAGGLLVTAAAAAALPAGAQAGTVGDQMLLAYTGITPTLVHDAEHGRYLVTAGSDTGGLSARTVTRSGPLAARTAFALEQDVPFFRPDLARNPSADQTLVVHGDGHGLQAQIVAAGGFAPAERRVRLAASGREPAVAYGSAPNEYLAVWQDTGSDGHSDVLARRVTPSGQPLGDTVRLSDRADVVDARLPDVAYRPGSGDYLVAWAGTRADGSTDVFAQRVGADGAERGADDAQVSDHRALGGSAQNTAPALAADAGTDVVVAFTDGNEIFARRLTGTAATRSAKDERLSTMGLPDDASYRTATPAIAYLPRTGGGRWLVTWSGNDTTSPQGGREAEIFGQEITSALGQVGPDDFTISQRSRPAGVPIDGRALDPAVAADPAAGSFMVAWWADDVVPGDPAYARRVDSAG